MTPSELKYQVENAGHESHFFTRKSMSFFGDTMRNYGVCSATVRTNYDADGNYVGESGVEIEVWELYRKHPVKHGNQESAYFDKASFRRVHIVR
jgi:hypothetical protein